MDPVSEAKNIAFDRLGNGEKVLLISGFPQTRRSWNKSCRCCRINSRPSRRTSQVSKFGDPSGSGDDGECRQIFHAFVSSIGAPLHVVAHDFGAWVAYSWALLFKDDFKSLTLIDAGIPGVTLTEDIQLSDFKRKWNFIFQMLPARRPRKIAVVNCVVGSRKTVLAVRASR